MSNVQHPRAVERIVQGRPTMDGAGVKLTRLLTQDLQRRLDPFLMLDAFASDDASDYVAGFPDHPHRGFETITYMLQGRLRHKDSAGNQGLLQSGGVQWMIAGRGVIHSEMPEQQEGRMEGFQLWLNLPAKDKMTAPSYQDLAAAQIPQFERDGVQVRVIAGTSHGVAGAVQRPITEPLYLDLAFEAGAVFEQVLPATCNALVVAQRGSLQVEGTELQAGAMAVLANGAPSDGVRLRAGPQPARVLLLAGQPLHEPIVQYGPFVMNHEAEIAQALQDFRAGRLA